ncbi:MAG: hypothetical protein HFG27_00395 [Provencibacterium sp.]|jgi:hypothetical protein|nr:hypothetical protein [Provencibacterium sp.]
MMDSCWIYMMLALCLLLAAGLRHMRQAAGYLRLSLCAPDEDIRIVTGSPSASLRTFPDASESVAEEFRRQKENGNIFMSNRLGEELAKPLLHGDGEMLGELWQEYPGQISFLYALAVRSMVEKKISNTILADTVLHSFSETIENTDEKIYRSVNDSVADTIYRLCLTDCQDVGGGFAKLCGKEEEARFAGAGAAAFQRFLDFSSARIDRIPFK